MKLQWGHGDEAVEEALADFAEKKGFKLQWGHGDEAVEEETLVPLQRRKIARFNGATAMKPWKSFACLSCSWAVLPLQWGHGDEAVEEGLGGFLGPAVQPASMGPRR